MSFHSEITKAINKLLVKEGKPQLPPLQEYVPQYQLLARVRDPDNEDNLAMRIADPLWMLGRQWQFGEFLGEDNGSPINVTPSVTKRKVKYFQTYKEVQDRHALNRVSLQNLPLEVGVEAMDIPLDDLRSKIKLGQQFERLIRRNLDAPSAEKHIKELRAFKDYKIIADTNLDKQSYRFSKLMEGKAINGAKVLQDIKKAKLVAKGFGDLVAIGRELLAWFDNTYTQAGTLFKTGKKNKPSWDTSQLSHKFTLHTSEKKANDINLLAPDFQNGHLDWYSFDNSNLEEVGANISSKLIQEEQIPETYLPVNLSLSAMPDKRLFAFEDNRVDLGSMDIQDDDLMRMMLMDFALVSGSDWYTIPLEMELGEICWINQIEVKDVFGIKTVIKNGKLGPMDVGPSLSIDIDNDGKLSGLDTWDLFKIRDKHITNYKHPEHFFFLAPALLGRQESEPIEEVVFVRDEFANMVWGIEKRVKNQLGKTVEGFDYHLERNGPFIPLEAGDKKEGRQYPTYRLASPVPTNWIPYLPRQVQGTIDQMELRRAFMISNEPDQPIKEIEPLTYLAAKDLITIREEAIPKAGVRVQLTKQRVRWTDGKTYIWQGRKVMPGRGEGDSGLQFDYLTT